MSHNMTRTGQVLEGLQYNSQVSYWQYVYNQRSACKHPWTRGSRRGAERGLLPNSSPPPIQSSKRRDAGCDSLKGWTAITSITSLHAKINLQRYGQAVLEMLEAPRQSGVCCTVAVCCTMHLL